MDSMVIYVSKTGDDGNTGESFSPFSTLYRAVEAVKAAINTGNTGSITVQIGQGDYFMNKPLRLDEQCLEGLEKMEFKAAAGEKVLLTGGVPVIKWELYNDHLWRAKVVKPEGETDYYKQLFVNGQRRDRGRYPFDGSILKVGERSADITNWGADISTFTNDRIARTSFTYAEGDFHAHFRNFEDIEIVLLQYWMESRMRVKAIDEKSRSVLLTGETWRPTQWSFGYYIDNVYEGLCTPGSWYYDKAEGYLYYHALDDEDINTVCAVLPVRTQLVCIKPNDSNQNLSNINFNGITFSYTDWELPPMGYSYYQAELGAPCAVYAENITNCTFIDCEFKSLGGWALWLGKGCRANIISRNIVSDTGAGFLKVGEETDCVNEEDEASDNTIIDNQISNGSKVYLGSPAIWVGQSSGNTISNNDISGAFQWAISVGWYWQIFPLHRCRDNSVSFNHIHDLGTGILGTHGAIYALGVQPGTKIVNNYVHHIYANDFWGAGEGIILDNGCAGILVENNVVHHAVAGGYGSNFNCFGNIIINNIFAYGEKFQLTRYGDPPTAGNHPNGEVFSRNIILWERGPLFNEKDWWSYNTYWDYNLYFAPGQEQPLFLKYTFQQWKEIGLDSHSVLGDPLFVDPQAGNFALRCGSPAVSIGFHPIDLSHVGPRKSWT